MSRILILLVAILVAGQYPHAQSTDPGSLHLATGVLKEEQGYLVIALAEYREAKRLSQSGEKKAAALNGIASIEVTMGNYDSALLYLRQSRSLDSTSLNLVMNYQVEAKYWQTQNQYDQALGFLQLALDHAVKLNDTRNRAIILSSMGSIYFSHEPDMKVARDFFNKSIALCDSSVHYNILARNYGRLANAYMVTGDGAAARLYLDRAKKIVDISDNLPVRGYILSSIATMLNSEGKYDECIALMQEPIRIKRELGQLRQLQNDLLNISEIYMTVKKYDKAQQALDEGAMISQSLKDIVYLRYFYERASILDSVKGDYNGAYSNLKLAMAYKDSTFSTQHLRDVREVQEKYETGQKEKTIAEKELEIEHQKYRQALILGTSIIAILVLMVIMIIIRARNRQRLQREREQQHQLRLHTIVKTQEEVQQRIARDLHDGLVQVLGAAKMSLQSAGPESDKPTLQKHIRNASDIMDEAVTEARSISHQLLPDSLLKDGLVSALEDLFARSLSSFKFDYPNEKIHLNDHTSINVYRIAQELVNNIQKHAESANVVASLRVTGDKLKFSFEDSGGGYDTSRPSNGAGLANMATRAELMGGNIVVYSTIGKGTRTELTIPL